MNDGYNWVVDIDLERFFDTVHHDRLMNIISRTIKDGDVISLIRKFLYSIRISCKVICERWYLIMNVFEVFGLLVLGSILNVFVVLIFLFFLIRMIRKALDQNIATASLVFEGGISKVENILKMFKPILSRFEKEEVE